MYTYIYIYRCSYRCSCRHRCRCRYRYRYKHRYRYRYRYRYTYRYRCRCRCRCTCRYRCRYRCRFCFADWLPVYGPLQNRYIYTQIQTHRKTDTEQLQIQIHLQMQTGKQNPTVRVPCWDNVLPFMEDDSPNVDFKVFSVSLGSLWYMWALPWAYPIGYQKDINKVFLQDTNGISYQDINRIPIGYQQDIQQESMGYQ